MEEKLSLFEFLNIIKKRFVIIFSFVLLSIGITAIISFLVLSPIYKAETQILVNQNSQSVQLSEQVETDLQLIKTYNVLIKSPAILNNVTEILQLNTSVESLTEQITVLSEDNSKVLNIIVEDKNHEQAVNIANTIAEVIKVEIPKLTHVDNITILSMATKAEDPKPVKPNKLLNMIISIVIGIMVGIGIAYILEILDKTINKETDIEEKLGLPSLGLISSIPENQEKISSSMRGISLTMPRKRKRSETKNNTPRNLVTFLEPKSIVAEQFKLLKTNIHFTLPDVRVRKILVTSSRQGEGKSTVAANLGVVFAQEGKKVLIIDADMRRPTLHSTFGFLNKEGLSNLLTNRIPIKDVIRETFLFKLYAISSGPIHPNPSELLASKNLDRFLKVMEDHFDIIIIDAPPVLLVTDAQILTNKCDGTILVVKAGETDKASALKAKTTLLTAKGNILGAVLNHAELPKDDYYQY